MNRYILLLSALVFSLELSGQNLNPTVQVTNTYEGKQLDMDKQGVRMAVPDSLLKFDWNFNYSVFDNPYKGAYEFSPYVIEMRPSPSPYNGRKLLVKLGAGYSLHPEALVVFNPELKGRWKLSLSDEFKSYFGKYGRMAPISQPSLSDGTYDSYRIGYEDMYEGNDMSNRFGTNLRYDGNRLAMTVAGNFDYIRTKEDIFDGNNAFGGDFSVRLKSTGPSTFSYDVSVNYDGISNRAALDGNKFEYLENNFGGDLALGIRLGVKSSLKVKGSFDYMMFSADYGERNLPFLDVSSYYEFKPGKFSMAAGVRYASTFSDPVRRLFPILNFSYEAIKDALVVFVGVDGSKTINSYASYLYQNHHFDIRFSDKYIDRFSTPVTKPFDAFLGVKGRLMSNLHYDVKAGYNKYIGSILPGFIKENGEIILDFDYLDYNQYYAEVNAAWQSDHFDASVRFRYQKSIPLIDTYAITSPRLTGNFNLTYNLKRRLFVGVNAEWRSLQFLPAVHEGSGNDPFYVLVPGWFDLGASAQFKINRNICVWLNGSNLLNQCVMRNIMYYESGPYFVAGATFSL